VAALVVNAEGLHRVLTLANALGLRLLDFGPTLASALVGRTGAHAARTDTFR